MGDCGYYHFFQNGIVYIPHPYDEKRYKSVLKEEEIKNVFPMTMNEWLWLDHILNAQMRTFEDMNAARLYKIAKDEEWANKSAAATQPSSH